MTSIKNRLASLEGKRGDTAKVGVIQLSHDEMLHYQTTGVLPSEIKNKCASHCMVVTRYDSVESWEDESKKLHEQTIGPTKL